jgi:glutaredoxin
MKTSTKVVIGLVVIVTIVIIGFRITGNGPTEPGIYDEFAKCLTENGAVMYGAYWCPYCANQKEMFGSSFDYVNYVECDLRGNNANPALCNEKGVTNYPTWIFADGTARQGEIPLRVLASTTDCTLPE